MTAKRLLEYPFWNDYAFDVECYPNIFTCVIVHIATRRRWIFEVSARRNQGAALIAFIMRLKACGARMVGFNNVAYDYPLMHPFLSLGFINYADIYERNAAYFKMDRDQQFKFRVWPSDMAVPQVDLFLLNHFDNQNKSTSLKACEIAMKMRNVQDLPFPPGEPIPEGGEDVLIGYNCHDVEATCQLAEECAEAMEFRAKVSAEYGFDATNFNETKIGKEFFRQELEKASPGCTGTRKRPAQTPRAFINLGELIVPYAKFDHPEFQRVRDEIAAKTITKTKDVLKGVKANIDGFEFKFGTGGIHGSVENRTFRKGGGWVILDYDVASFYPNLAIVNNFRPAHLGDTFGTIYKRLYDYRLEVGKKTLPGETVKLGLNGVFGDSNSKFSPFYDPAFTMSITINGQLLLCLLAEWMLSTGGAHMIQANTDGITLLVRESHVGQVRAAAEHWQKYTRLELEEVEYAQMSIRDVNNYVAVTTAGKVKRKGAYEFEYKLHQNPSATILARAAAGAIVDGVPVEQTICNATDPFEFLLRYKGQRRDRIMWGGGIEPYNSGRIDAKGKPIMWNRHNGQGQQIQRTGRYYAAHRGAPLFKIMPPRPDKPEHYRPQAINDGWNHHTANRAEEFDPRNLNLDFYITKAKTLVTEAGL